MRLAPSILSANFRHLAKEIDSLCKAGADLLHVDIMDGHFVPNITFGPMIVSTIHEASSVPLDVHLMILQPEYWIEKYAESGAHCIYVHQETCSHLHRIFDQIRKLDCKVGVALNPGTSLHTLDHSLELVDRVLVMTVNPGFGGQSFIPSMLPKIRQLNERRRTHNLTFEIAVDGGIHDGNIASVRQEGADIVVSGSFLFTNDDYRSNINSLRLASTQEGKQ